MTISGPLLFWRTIAAIVVTLTFYAAAQAIPPAYPPNVDQAPASSRPTTWLDGWCAR